MKKDSKHNTIRPIKHPDKIINYWKNQKFIILLIVLSGTIFNVGMSLGPVYQGKLIDTLVDGQPLSLISKVAATFVVIIVVVQILRYVKRFYIRRFANNTSASMRYMIYNNLIHKGERELSKENMGTLMTNAISDVNVCTEGMRKFTTEIFDTGVLLTSYLVTLFIYDVKITAIAAIFTPIAMLIAEKLKKRIFKYTKAFRTATSEVAGATYELIDNVVLYRIYGREHDNREVYEEQLKDLEVKAVYANVWENSMQPIYNIIAMAGVVFIIYFGGKNVLADIWTIGQFSTYITVFTALAFKASKAAKLFNAVQKSQVSWRRIKPYLKEYEEISHNYDVPDDMSLVITNLCFSYESDKNILSDVNLSMSKGDFVGVTGPVACGKSSLGCIFLGEYQYLGSILLCGKELSEYSEFERSENIAYLGHNPHLISDTIYNNITLGDENGTDINEVLKMVCFDEDLKQMEEGINTIVGNNGVRLSGGQQSRIALARTLYHRRKLIILDDPFSAVDINTEKAIIENMKSIIKESMIILISHRMTMKDNLTQLVTLGKEGESNE